MQPSSLSGVAHLFSNLPLCKVIELHENLLIGKGAQRACYRHPGEPELCLKIPNADNSHALRCQKSEIRYLLANRSEALYGYHGQIDTTLGEAGVFDLIKDPGGELSPSLKSAVESGALVGSALENALSTLRAELVAKRIILHDLHPENLLYQSSAAGAGRLIFIDGIGDPSKLGWLKNFGPLRSFAFDRRWKRLQRRLRRHHPEATAGI